MEKIFIFSERLEAWEIPLKYSGKMWLLIILKATKKPTAPLSRRVIFGKTTE